MIRVMIVVAHAMLRDGLQTLLEGAGDLEVVGHGGDGIKAVEGARDAHRVEIGGASNQASATSPSAQSQRVS